MEAVVPVMRSRRGSSWRRHSAPMCRSSTSGTHRTQFLGSPYYQNVLTEEGKHARGVITDAKLHAVRYDVDPDYEVLEGEPVESILGFADSRDADLIVVGSRGLGRVAGTVLGSVSKEIIRRAERPVMLAKERAHVAAR